MSRSLVGSTPTLFRQSVPRPGNGLPEIEADGIAAKAGAEPPAIWGKATALRVEGGRATGTSAFADVAHGI